MMIRKLFKAEMAHSTVGAYTKRCHHLHGHSYKFELFLRSDRPNTAQMVSDFRAVKDVGINDFFDSFDHAVTLWDKDPRAKIIGQINPDRHVIVPFNPTAEMLAKAFFHVCQAIVETGPKLSGEDDARVSQVIVHETDTGYAVYNESDQKTDGFPDIQWDRWIFSDGVKAAWSDRGWFERIGARVLKTSPSPSLGFRSNP
jgi:6-pyruvoyltetrahydropterin/6-carboxytetrahydropterin synthase